MRPTVAHISLAAIGHNLAVARRLAGTAEVTAVVKANAYGHGAAAILPALASAPRLAVASLEEAMLLREAGARQPILLLEGPFEASELEACVQHRCAIAVHEPGQIEMVERAPASSSLEVWLKLDSGMGRLGFAAQRAALGACAIAGGVLCIGVEPHDAFGIRRHGRPCADGQAAPPVRFCDRGTAGEAIDRQFRRSDLAARCACRHGAPRRHALWRHAPWRDGRARMTACGPAMTLTTRLIATKTIEAGETVGYGGTWRAERRQRIGIAAIGYGDGYPRHAPTGTPVLVGAPSKSLGGTRFHGHDRCRSRWAGRDRGQVRR